MGYPKGEKTMSEDKLRRSLMALVEPKDRGRAAGILTRLLNGRETPSGGSMHRLVYIAEYEGVAPRACASESSAKSACEEGLSAEEASQSWDWFADEDGWIRRQVDPDTNAPLGLLCGRVTKAYMEH